MRRLRIIPKLRAMHTLSRRIEELEKAALAIRRDREFLEEQAMWDLTPDELELLISAIGAEKQGRPFNAAESAARQAYTRAVEAECRWSPLSSNGLFKATFDLRKGIPMMLAQTFSEEENDLAVCCERAQEEGRTPTEAELASFERSESLVQRLLQLAGCSPAERMGEEVSDGATGSAI
jgi:hypothetical protein